MDQSIGRRKLHQQTNFWKALTDEYEKRIKNLKEKRCELRHRLELMDVAVPALLCLNLITPTDNTEVINTECSEESIAAGVEEEKPICDCDPCDAAEEGVTCHGVTIAEPKDSICTCSSVCGSTCAKPKSVSSKTTVCSCFSKEGPCTCNGDVAGESTQEGDEPEDLEPKEDADSPAGDGDTDVDEAPAEDEETLDIAIDSASGEKYKCMCGLDFKEDAAVDDIEKILECLCKLELPGEVQNEACKCESGEEGESEVKVKIADSRSGSKFTCKCDSKQEEIEIREIDSLYIDYVRDPPISLTEKPSSIKTKASTTSKSVTIEDSTKLDVCGSMPFSASQTEKLESKGGSKTQGFLENSECDCDPCPVIQYNQELKSSALDKNKIYVICNCKFQPIFDNEYEKLVDYKEVEIKVTDSTTKSKTSQDPKGNNCSC